jgi:hypothetical protein
LLDPVGRARTTEARGGSDNHGVHGPPTIREEKRTTMTTVRRPSTTSPVGRINTHLSKTIESWPKVKTEVLGLVRYGAGRIYMHVEYGTYIQYVGRSAFCM